MQSVMPNKKTIIIFSPLPPRENGIADYVSEQLHFLKKFFDIIAVIDNGAPYPDALSKTARVLRLEEYLGVRKALNDFVHVYHVGNNPDHGYMLPILLSKPGLVVIHDLGLHHLYDSQTLTKGNFSAYSYELTKLYGRFGKLLGNQVKDVGWKGGFMPHELRFNGEVIRAACSIVVHSEYSKNEIAREWPLKKVFMIPHHLSPKLKNYHSSRRVDYKAELGLPSDGVVLTSLGFITEAKQARAVLKALAVLKSEGLNFVYVFAGAYRPNEYDVKKDISQFGLEDRVKITGFLSDDDFFSYLVASDVVINLRYPYGGETSGTLTRALGMGRCCLVVDIGAFAEVPDDCALKLPWSKSFDKDLLRALRLVIDSPAVRADFEIKSHDWSNGRQKISDTVNLYAEVIHDTKSDTEFKPRIMGRVGAEKRVYISSKEIERLAANHVPLLNSLISDDGGYLWWREGVVQSGSDRATPVLLYSDNTFTLEVLISLFDYKERQIVNMTWGPSSSSRFHSYSSESHEQSKYIIALIKVSLLDDDPMPFLFELAWRLETGSEALISLVNDLPVSSSGRSLSSKVWLHCLEAAGFYVAETHQSPSAINLHGLEKPKFPEWISRVVKVSKTAERFPREYYGRNRDEFLKLAPGHDSSESFEFSEPVLIVGGEG